MYIAGAGGDGYWTKYYTVQIKCAKILVYVDLELRMLPRSPATLMKSAVAVHIFLQSWNDP